MIYYIIFYYVWCPPLSLLGVWRALLPVDVMSCHILVVWCLVVWGSPSLVDVMWRRPNVAWRGVPHYVGVVWSPPLWCGVVWCVVPPPVPRGRDVVPSKIWCGVASPTLWMWWGTPRVMCLQCLPLHTRQGCALPHIVIAMLSPLFYIAIHYIK